MAKLTPAQTIGPFFHEGLKWAVTAPQAGASATASVAGRVLDRDGAAITDALIEIWRPGWPGSGLASIAGLQRIYTDDSGRFTFALPRPAQGQVHANVNVFARGLLRGLFTRVYLHAAADAAAVILPQSVPAARRDTLIAHRTASGEYEWNICLSGANETVFFDL
jgi:protocatechuate 3,4-dioxygenase alpha subunit